MCVVTWSLNTQTVSHGQTTQSLTVDQLINIEGISTFWHYECPCHGYILQKFCVDVYFGVSLGIYLRVVQLDLEIHQLPASPGTSTIISTVSAWVFHSHQEWTFPLFHILSNISCHLLLIVATLTCGMWTLRVVCFCISLLANDVEHFFVRVSQPFEIPLLRIFSFDMFCLFVL